MRALLLRHSTEAHSLFGEYVSVAARLRDLTFSKFDQLAGRQTLWQEESNVGSIRKGQQSDPETLKVQLRSILVAAREMKEAEEAANKTMQEAGRVSKCLSGEDPISVPAALTTLIDDIEHSPTNYVLLASNIVAAYTEAESMELVDGSSLLGCAVSAAENKKAGTMVSEAFGAEHSLRKAIVEFEPLIVNQAEWEERIVQNQIVLQEQ